MSEPLLVARGVEKKYRMGSSVIEVLKGLDLEIGEGEVVAVVGASGIGKSTLLHILGLLDRPDAGTVHCREIDLFALGQRERASWRNDTFGFIFQFYHLVPELTALENVVLPVMIGTGVMDWGGRKRAARARAREILVQLGLEGRLKHRPPQLSGGERQRVAIARALVNDPDLLLCDEPTGNLDPETSSGVSEALWRMNEQREQAMLLVTHDERLAARADRVLRMVDGRLVPENGRGAPTPVAASLEPQTTATESPNSQPDTCVDPDPDR
jgi:lipoprotein-releasing system ATP-binding protein